jgi:hypothetical protein
MAASAAWAQMLKKLPWNQAFRGSNEGETEHQFSMMMNWLLPKNRADVYVVTVESKQVCVMVVK